MLTNQSEESNSSYQKLTEVNGTAIVPVAAPVVVPAATKKQKDQVVIKVVSFGIGAVLIAINLTGNSLMMVAEGHPGAGSLTTSFQSLLLGVSGGALMSGGVALGKPIGEKDFTTASEIAVASYALTAGLTLLSTIAYGSTYFAFPSLFSADTAKAASTYFLISSLGNWPALALVTTGQMAFQCNDWKSPLISTAAFRLPSIGLSYLFSRFAKMDVAGIALGNTIAPWLSYIGMELWLRRNEFQILKQVKFSRAIVAKHAKSLSTLAAKMSFQRITEWGNLAVITSLLGAKSSNNLPVVNPSLQIMVLFNLFSQGIGLGGNMLLAVQRQEFKGLLQQARNDKSPLTLAKVEEAQQKIKNTCIKSITGALLTNSVLAAVLYFAREPIVNLFLNSSASASMHETAEYTLWINGLGLIADSLRLVSTNLLNTYDKIMTPNWISLILMTVIGIPLAYFPLQKTAEGESVIFMFAIRSAMIMLSALYNCYDLYKSFKADSMLIEEVKATVIDEPSLQSTVKASLNNELDSSSLVRAASSCDNVQQAARAAYNRYGSFRKANASQTQALLLTVNEEPSQTDLEVEMPISPRLGASYGISVL